MQGSYRIVVANWKMYLARVALIDLVSDLVKAIDQISGIVVCPSAVHLEYVASQLSNKDRIELCAQNISGYSLGGYTGEIAAENVKEIGCSYTLLGHSECRKMYQEGNNLIVNKVRKAISIGLKPIICVGEPLSVRNRGSTLDYISEQLAELISAEFRNEDLIVAYEPVWAIGSNIVPTNREIYEVLTAIKVMIPRAKTLYGGSVNYENSKAISEINCLDGVLVGAASIRVEEFLKIAKQIQRPSFM